jgi:hypothetical protein
MKIVISTFIAGILILSGVTAVAYINTYGNYSNHPPIDPVITGPSRGKVGVSYIYDFVSTDPEQQNISYFIDWGDGTNINWTEYHPSGQDLLFMHTFNKMDRYDIRCKAKDILGAESNWSYMSIPMAYYFTINDNLLGRFFKLLPFTILILLYLSGLI